ncbi:MAG: FdtA/QdtA family cupin domain-containing protein [bacterium]|nr:FdtA/QdtA family cupin domain-containing protein [bacterium]
MLYNSGLLKFRKISSPSNDKLGYLTPIECPNDIPFEIKRIYYIYDVKKEIVRGNHSHKKLHQVLLCLNGSIDIRLENFFGEKKFTLNDPSVGLYVGPDNWREMSNFSEEAVLLVLASEKYDEDDYIRDYDTFVEYNQKKYGGIK